MPEADNASAFQVSLSAFQVWQQCETRYYYQYVRKLRIRDKFVAPTLGRVLHEYLEHYHNNLAAGYSAEDSHLSAQLKTSANVEPEIRQYAQTAYLGGAEELAKELLEIPHLAGRITDRYFKVRGRSDAERYKFLLVERWLNLPIYDGIRSTGVADLVTQDQETGRLNLWEHKSTQNVPSDSVRLRDLQTMLYSVKLRWQEGLTIDSVIWNYIRTKEPSVPEVLKSGQLTKRNNLDSTWETYLATAEENGLYLGEDYSEVRDRLLDRELTVFFPRYEQVIVVSENVLMDDYIIEARRMKRAREAWANGSTPVRSISRSCDYCEYNKVCMAVLTGGDEEDVIRMRFDER